MLTIDEALNEIDMGDLLLRVEKGSAANQRKAAVNDFSGLVCQISSRSVQEIDHLIVGLRGVREKLNYDGAKLENEIASHAQLSDLVVQLTKIVSDSMAQVNSSSAKGR